ncbi:MAG: tetratricopeptide repeat protein [Coriobacteriia bacterium]|nr:tetratricopeptide repeat protein [Coriobacteriia bacterium]
MDDARFQEAKQAYDAGDYRTSAKSFLAAAVGGAEGNGAAYHMAGNSLMRLRRYSDAVTVYRHALRDEVYDRHGSVRANLAAAYSSLGDYADAVKEYGASLEEPDNTTPHKAMQGMASALVEMGRYEDAAASYRQAALDAGNPDPGKALNSLGLCFMALQRPEDAIESYKAALGFDTYAGKGRALANLGIAFSSLGSHEEALKAFEKATQLHGHTLSPQAIEAFNQSRDATIPKHETVEGWSTGEMPPVLPDSSGEPAGWDTGELSALGGSSTEFELDVSKAPAVDSSGVEFGDEEAVSSFFTMTDEQMREIDKESRRAARDARREGSNPWIAVGIAVLFIVVVVGGLAALYTMGFGYPTQSMTVEGMLDARAEGAEVDDYWVATVAPDDVEKEMSKLPPAKQYEIKTVQRGRGQSVVTAAVTPEDGSPLILEITLGREGVGWKVTGIEIVFNDRSGGV